MKKFLKPISKIDPSDKNDRLKVAVYFLSLVGLLSLSFFTVFSFINNNKTEAYFLLILIGTTLANILYLRFSKNNQTAVHITLTHVLLVMLAIFIFFSVKEYDIYWFYMYPLLSVFLSGNRNGSFYSVSLLVLSIIINYYNPDFMEKTYAADRMLRFSFAYVIVLIMANIYEFMHYRFRLKIKQNSNSQKQLLEETISKNKQLSKANERISQKQDIIEKQKDELEQVLDTQYRLNDQFVKVNVKFENQQKELIKYNKELEQEKEKSQELLQELQSQNDEIQLINTALTEKQELVSKKNKELNETLKIVSSQQEKITSINKDIRDGLYYAKTIQDAMLPSDTVLDEILQDYFLIFEPKEIVGGDFYYAAQINNYLIFAVADSTGHGIPGGFMSMLGISFLHNIIHRTETDEAGLVLDLMRKRIKEIFYKAESYNHNGLDIAFCAVNIDSGMMQYAGAFNPIIIFRNNELIEQKATRNPIGIYPIEKQFKTSYIQLQENDMIYLYSDGFHDQIGQKTQKKLGSKHFKNTLYSLHNMDLKKQKQYLLKTFRDWKGNQEQTDDVCLLGLRWHKRKHKT